MLDLARADAVRQRAEGAVRRGMAVAADDGRAGQREALLGPDHMHDALALVALVVIFDAEIAGVLRQRFDLQRRLGIVDALGAVGGRHVVIDHGQRLLRRAHLAAGHAQALESLRARHLVHQMAIDIEQAGAVRRFVHQMGVPDLVVEGAGLGHGCRQIRIVKRQIAIGTPIANSVMPGLGPGIHDLTPKGKENVDGRDKPGHDRAVQNGKNPSPFWAFWRAWPLWLSPALRASPRQRPRRLRSLPRPGRGPRRPWSRPSARRIWRPNRYSRWRR